MTFRKIIFVALSFLISAYAETGSKHLKTSTSCVAVAQHFEREHGIPEKLLLAILKIESRFSPWAVNAGDHSRVFTNRDDAVRHVHSLKKKGITNINLGCGQLNWPSHKNRFKDVHHAFSPYDNVQYAASLLKKLYRQKGSWERAVQLYHSALSHYAIPYQEKVYSIRAQLLKKEVRKKVSSPKALKSTAQKRRIYTLF